ncbi:MAG: cytochrome c biogenesis protein CcsA [Fimbriimonadaceae bacterium]|nr:cytochrome c biogenesis protein CcsA [Fimbriimonadaceae bacterium]
MQDFADLKEAPAWAAAVAQTGQGAVLLSVVAFVAAAFLWWTSSQHPDRERSARWAGLFGAVALFAAFACVGVLFVTDQFQFQYVFAHAARDHELQYKIAGIWSGQEGSFLLWAVTSAVFFLLVGPRTGVDRRWFSIVYTLFLAALVGILAFESPFKPIDLIDGKWLVPPDGRGLAPSLLNYWVVIHPPTIFLGFGSLAALFAWATAATVRRDPHSWLPLVRPWALVSLSLLGLGLCMGGFWAYETLGWGGFWMWDPVENTSFVPWVAVAAFVHGAFLQAAKRRGHLTNLIGGALPFVSFVYGTFLTRSGFLGDTSVHSFAEMDRSALWILVSVGSLAAVAFGVIFARNYRGLAAAAGELATKPAFWTRDTFYQVGIWLLCTFGVIAAVGMSVPLFQSLAGQKPKVVEEHLYHQVLSYPFVPIMLMIAVAPFLTWRGTGFKAVFAKLSNSLAVAVGLSGCLLLWVKRGDQGFLADESRTIAFTPGFSVPATPWVVFLSFLCLFALVANVWRLVESFRGSWKSAGGYLTHVGLATALLGLVFSRGFEKKEVVMVDRVTDANFFGRTMRLVGPTGSFADRHNRVVIDVTGPEGKFQAKPGMYLTMMNDKPTPMTWPWVESFWLHDLYFTIHEPSLEASDPLRLQKGQVGTFHDLGFRYTGMRHEGPVGQAGSTFYADFNILTPEGESKGSPSLMLKGEGGFSYVDVPISERYALRLVGMDAKDKSAMVQIMFRSPAYPVEVFYKPLVRAVWGGVGIMTLGGLVAAWGRRSDRKRPTDDDQEPEAEVDASEPTPEVETAPRAGHVR